MSGQGTCVLRASEIMLTIGINLIVIRAHKRYDNMGKESWLAYTTISC